MMASISSLQLFQVLRPCRHHGESARFERQDWNFKLSNQINMPLHAVPTVHCVVTCQSALVSGHSNTAIIGSMKIVALALTRACRALQESSLVVQCAPAVGIMAFATWGLGPLLQFIRHLIFRAILAAYYRRMKLHLCSGMIAHIMTSYLQPILRWMGAILICRAFDPVVLSSETRQAINVRGDDREAVHIPNHKFTVSIVRNLSQKSHWRIKTHLAISHLDANKIGIIVADMRKVLAKNPQVEQQRLHRRVFLDSIDRENQALLIFVSCFVKTPHIEEYLCVKEAILLDLLRVIGHHRARLATPIRSVQKIYYDSEMQNVPFGDTRFGRGMANSRPFLLAEASPKLNGEDKVKQRSPRSNEELNTVHPKPVASEAKGTEAALISSNDTVKQDSLDKKNIQNQKERDHTTVNLQSKNGKLSTMDGVQASPTKSHLEGLDSMGLNSKDITLLGAAFEKPPVNIPEVPVETGIPKSEKNISKNEKSTINSSDKQFHQNVSTSEKNMKKLSSEADSSITEVSREEAKSGSRFESDLRSDAGKQKGEEHSTLSSPKHESERSVNFPSISRPQLEENLVLGVALDGPKRTLPIGGEITSQVEQKEFSTCRNGNNNSIVKDRREAQLPSSHGVQPDQREQER